MSWCLLAFTHLMQKMERLNTERRLQCIKDRRQEHTTVSKPVKRPLGDHFEHLNRRSPKEPKLENHTAEESSDDGGDIEFSGERQPSFSRQSPTVPCSRENPLRSPTIVQSSGPQQQSKPNMQYRPKSYTSPNSAATPAPVKTAKSRPDVPPQDYPSQRRVAERTASSSSSADTQPRSPSITNPNHTVGTTKDPRSTPQTNGTRGTPENDVTRLTDSKHPAPSHPSLQLPPKPPTPLPTPQQTSLQQPITISQQSTSQEHTSQQPVHQQPFYQKPVHQQHPQQQPTTQQPLGPPGEPNKPSSRSSDADTRRRGHGTRRKAKRKRCPSAKDI
ncbi:hypothetical protein BDW74DRAFT_8166 [Aspergillus multicolor]|uniref:uncharacterized protein n=1 Tax=Aspergillus multicolor TaxID=41759 RepID=UPI003CCDA884